MSCTPADAATTTAAEVCANCCGKERNDSAKLKNCTACRLVKYCDVDCQRAHRKQHKRACKKRAAELKDERLYGQGHERQEADFCPLCFLAIPFRVADHATMYTCCMKTVCNGCEHAAMKRGLGRSCPFCRAPPPENHAQSLETIRKRVDAKDTAAIYHLGCQYYSGELGLKKNVPRGIELWSKAAELGSTMALFKLGMLNYQGWGVAQDKAKGIHCCELAAMQGHTESRHLLGMDEYINENYDRALRHYLIAAKMGHEESLDAIKEIFAEGRATKAQYAEALKGYQDAMEEMNSSDREEAAKLRWTDSLTTESRRRQAQELLDLPPRQV